MSRMTPVAVLLMETLASATGAPDASVTVPERVAPATCAWTGGDTRTASANTHTNKPRQKTIRFSPGVVVHLPRSNEEFGHHLFGGDVKVSGPLSPIESSNDLEANSF